jgi:sterol desaturase/sphingolipid hydroxylase (fatty acid hydroxylase superfamily)
MKIERVNPVHIIVGTSFLLLGMLMIANWELVKVPLIDTCNSILGDNLCGSELRGMMGNFLWVVSLLPIVLFVEIFFRAKPNQAIFSVGLFQDFVWYIFLIFFVALMLNQYIDFLATSFDSYFPMLHVDLIASLPTSIQIIVVILISDFIGWFDHWVRHKIPFLWEFHKIHHSPRELNFFTNMRVHPVDYIAIPVIGIPFLMLDLDVAVSTFIGWIIFKELHLFLIHANFRTNFGIFRYILTTPQSHRIHHSIEQRHQHLNLGVQFVFWDFLFGTQWTEWDEYPDTGIEDEDFPLEVSARPKDLLGTMYRQFIHPFTRVLQK